MSTTLRLVLAWTALSAWLSLLLAGFALGGWIHALLAVAVTLFAAGLAPSRGKDDDADEDEDAGQS